MQFLKLATALSILSVVSAETVYVTQTHLTTIQGGEGQEATTQAEVATATGSPSVAAEVKAQKSILADGEGSTQSAAPTTLVSKTTSASEPASTSSDSSSSGSGISGVEDQDFAETILKAHNDKRAKHNVDDLSWDSQVYKYAQDYADQYDCSGSLSHSGGKYGENLAVGYDSAEKAVNAWYEEGDNYDYSSSSSFDHFTQIIWKDTTKLGCAYKDCSSAGRYIVCSYDPAGNVIGQGKANLSA